VRGAALRGIVHGGQNPISGAHVYLLAMPNNGYYAGPGIAPSSNNASVSLLTSGDGSDSIGTYVLSASDGTFTITGDYACPSAYSFLYLYSVGGNPGLAQGTNNTAATLLAVVKACDSSDYVIVNEVSTIATVYAFAGFITDPTHISSSGTSLALTGLSNASQTLENLYTRSTGLAKTTTLGGNGAVPQAEINTLADILAACVNSTGPGSSNCSILFSNAMNGSTAPADTATAAINIAHNPGVNMAALFALQQGTGAPFQPMLSAAPNDWTIAITYSAGLVNPWGMAVDGSGNVWIANTFANYVDEPPGMGFSASNVVELNPTGAVLSGSSGYTGGLRYAYGIAIDNTGSAWVGSFPGSLVKFSSSGTVLSGSSGYTGGGLDGPFGVAIDKNGNVWLSNEYASFSEFSSSGAALSPSTGFPGGGVNYSDIAIDTVGDIWIPNTSFADVSEFSSAGVALSPSGGFTGGGLSHAGGLAIDASGNVWVASIQLSGVLSEFDNSGTPISPSTGYSGGGLINAYHLAIDGSGNIWAPDEICYSGRCNISEFSSNGTAISPSSGYRATTGPWTDYAAAWTNDIAIDGSGNVWAVGATLVTEFVGAATPVVTPKVANLMSPYGQHAVNRP
jgi:hypothetical protein